MTTTAKDEDALFSQPFSIELANALFDVARTFDDDSSEADAMYEATSILGGAAIRRDARAKAIARRRPRDMIACLVLWRNRVPAFIRSSAIERFRFVDCLMGFCRMNNVRISRWTENYNYFRIDRRFYFARNFRLLDPEHTLSRVTLRISGFDVADFAYDSDEGAWILQNCFRPPHVPLPLYFMLWSNTLVSTCGRRTDDHVVVYDGVCAITASAHAWINNNGYYPAAVSSPPHEEVQWVVSRGCFRANNRYDQRTSGS